MQYDLFSFTETKLKLLLVSLRLNSSPLPVSSRPSALKQASWLYGSAVWKSPTKTSRSPRKTSCTRNRRAHRRGFTSNLQTFVFLSPSPLLYLPLCERTEAAVELPVSPEFWYILCMSCLVSPTLLLPLCVKTINKRTTKKERLSVCVSHLFYPFILPGHSGLQHPLKSCLYRGSICWRLLIIGFLYIEFIAVL